MVEQTPFDFDACERSHLGRNGHNIKAIAVRSLGLQVGDFIWGRFVNRLNAELWNERVLQLLWCGEELAVFRVWGRSADDPLTWRLKSVEDASWWLGGRDWYKLIPPAAKS